MLPARGPLRAVRWALNWVGWESVRFLPHSRFGRAAPVSEGATRRAVAVF
jgi:hypothetical protein